MEGMLMMLLTGLLTMVLAGIGAQTPAAAPQRFDDLVRADFFAGFAGDAARLQKGMDACEHTLADNPLHAEALVWHGSGLFFLGGRAFSTGDMATGGRLVTQGLEEMDKAVALAPDKVSVLVPRGAVLLTATRRMSPDSGRPLLESALANYEHVLTLQAPFFVTLGDHPKGELLFGLAEGYYRLGDMQKARQYFERLTTDAPASGHTVKAQAFLTSGTLAKTEGLGCVGCHK
jgi:tetratricopeptide (TPR) repeat protein